MAHSGVDMKWHGDNFHTSKYYIDLAAAIRDESFPDFKDDYHPQFQIGVLLMERADLILREHFIEKAEKDTELVKYALNAVRLAVLYYPDFVEAHVILSIGVFSWAGIFATMDAEVLHLWQDAKPTLTRNGNKALLILVQAALADQEFTDILLDLQRCGEREMDRDAALELLVEDYGYQRLLPLIQVGAFAN